MPRWKRHSTARTGRLARSLPQASSTPQAPPQFVSHSGETSDTSLQTRVTAARCCPVVAGRLSSRLTTSQTHRRRESASRLAAGSSKMGTSMACSDARVLLEIITSNRSSLGTTSILTWTVKSASLCRPRQSLKRRLLLQRRRLRRPGIRRPAHSPAPRTFLCKTSTLKRMSSSC